MKKLTILIIPLIAIALAMYQMSSTSKKQPAKVIFIIGGPGSGKGVQSQLLSEEFGFIHLSIGDLMRHKSKTEGQLGSKILEAMNKGELVSNEIIARSLDETFDFKGREKVYLLDGFPRSVDNFLGYQEYTNNTLNIAGIIYLDCSNQTMERRILERAKTVNRPDNDIEVIRNRILFYNHNTNMLIQNFKDKTVLLEISAEETIEKVYQELRKQIIVLGYNPVNPTPKL